MTFGKRTSPLPPDRFAPSDWRALVTLPLQVGLWMTAVDEGEAPDAKTKEQAAIPIFLNQAATKFSNIPLIVQICTGARAEVPESAALPSEEALMAKAGEILTRTQGALTALERNAYKLLLIEMAEHVARAAPDRPPGAYNLMNGAKDGWYGLYPAFLNRTLRYGRGPKVSVSEKAAINRLIDTLQAEGLVQKWEVGTPEAGPSVRVYSDEGGVVSQRTTRAIP